MPLAFAISLIGLAWLSETMRQGVIGMNSLETNTVTHVAAAALAILILRSDLVLLVRRPAALVSGPHPMDWSLKQSLLGMAIAPVLFGLPMVYMVLNGQPLPDIRTLLLALPITIETLFLKTLLLAICVELFFREAALCAFRENRAALVVASTLAYFVFCLSSGLAAAMVAAGAGLFYLVLRLSGTHILIVALIHAVVATGLALIAPEFTQSLASAIFFTVSAAALSLTILSLSSPRRSVLSHA